MTTQDKANSHNRYRGSSSCELDESTWRASLVPPKYQITKARAKRLYRLDDDDLAGLPFRKGHRDQPPNVEVNFRPAIYYNEREVERRAWNKYGGPEGFDTYIEHLRSKWADRQEFARQEAQNTGKPIKAIAFVAPMWQPRCVTSAPSNAPPSRTKTNLDPLQSRFPASWLWEACNNALCDDSDDAMVWIPQERELALCTALVDLPKYPPRLLTPLPQSSVIHVLLAILSYAPRPNFVGDVQPSGIARVRCSSGDIDWIWTELYLEPLFAALISVIKEHGLGCLGWKRIRWEVYQTHTRCLQGIHYYRDAGSKLRWFDGASIWLAGRRDCRDVGYIRTRGRCPNGEVYNNMLPEISC